MIFVAIKKTPENLFYLAQSSLPPGRFQKETVTVLPLIHFQFLGSRASR
jgi:hypothetical protein